MVLVYVRRRGWEPQGWRTKLTDTTTANITDGHIAGDRPPAAAGDDPDTQIITKRWGEAIRQARIALGESQAWLAEQIGVNQSLVSFWEHGRRAPTLEKQLTLARVLGMSPAVLFPLPDTAAAS